MLTRPTRGAHGRLSAAMSLAEGEPTLVVRNMQEYEDAAVAFARRVDTAPAEAARRTPFQPARARLTWRLFHGDETAPLTVRGLKMMWEVGGVAARRRLRPGATEDAALACLEADAASVWPEGSGVPPWRRYHIIVAATDAGG